MNSANPASAKNSQRFASENSQAPDDTVDTVIEGSGIIESALRRGKVGKELVVWGGKKVKPSQEVLLAHDSGHEHSERLRSLRTELLMHMAGRDTAMFALVSADKGVGRSRLCAELALAFAQLGGKTLLVDADLRNPRQHTLFNAENDSGLSQALTNSREAVFFRVEGVPHLNLITSGPPLPNPLELLSSIQFQQLISEWRRTYQYVIVDTPAAKGCSDAITIASVVGQTVLVGRTEITPMQEVKELLNKLQTSNTRVIGAVMNSF